MWTEGGGVKNLIFCGRHKWMTPKSKLGVVSKYLVDQICSPLSAMSHRPLRSARRGRISLFPELGPYRPNHMFDTVGPSLWNALPYFSFAFFVSSCILLPPENFFYSWSPCTGSAVDWSLL